MTQVHITKSDGHTDNDHAHISKGEAGAEVRWFAHDNESAKIRFKKPKGSPFLKDGPFDVPAGKNVPSGALKPSVRVGDHYPYAVEAPDGNYDPEVIIDP